MESTVAQQNSKDNQQDFIVGDVVVLKNYVTEPYCNDLFTVTKVKGDYLGDWVVMLNFNNDEWTSGTQYLRCATVAELHAKRRLTKTEQALAEVT
ncbi:hypothetical protein [Acinetobacter sp. WCHAc010052]|uniref:hypothetical protein n=1 Tax=Acinetobacter sp. WCHAc010052 TaxID=2004647 RepID=UPI000B3CA0C1|nr:hypothetical protein [Acinetobacter sp. WCHAc010052]AXY60000.1 hypothetical protein CDG61_08165 [Acinetobacter sp. WCHAc010052]